LNKQGGHTHYYCYNCLSGYQTQEKLDEHKKMKCQDFECAKAILPKPEDAIIKFTNIHKQLRKPVVVYADFEALTVPVENGREYQNHKGCSYGFAIISDYPELAREYKSFRGEDAIHTILKDLMKEFDTILPIMKQNKEMIISEQQQIEFENSKNCHICDEQLLDDRVRDHDHITGLYRGSAHSSCNIKYCQKGRIPVVFHNLRGYDSHLIMQEIEKVSSKITAIPNTEEKYMTFTMGNFVFIDSLQFLNASLEAVVSSLGNDKTKFKNMYAGFPEYLEDQIKLLCKKGVYPYDFMNSWESFDAKLPTKEQFFSKLYNTKISDEDYAHAKNIWETFDYYDMGEYNDLYLKTDVLLLADVFENFRNTCLENYGLDPCHYFTAPSLSWDAMLKKTKIEIETFNDQQYDMMLLAERGIRGGISMISHRYAKANNKYCSEYDESKPDEYIMYLDANNLYGKAMSEPLPVGNYKWEDITNFNVNQSVAGDRGYVLEVDLEYPEHLHDLHSDYPLAPENCKGEYSPLMKQYYRDLGYSEKEIKNTNKLIPNLRGKKNYVIHLKNLQLYLSLGIILTKIHRIVSFIQAPWLQYYINFNTDQRKKAKNDFEKDLYKLMNNAIFGKCLENVRNRIDVKLKTTPESIQKLINKPTFKGATQFGNNLTAVHMSKTEIKFDKPIMIGFSVLELSKHLMYDFHYNKIKAKYQNNATLLMTDTDSLVYSIKTKDLYADFLQTPDEFDFSEYPKNHPNYSEKNKKVIGKMKDETNGIPIKEFIGLRAKMYSMKLETGKEKKTGKGIKKQVVKNEITHENYRRAIFPECNEDLQQKVKFNLIRSKGHNISSIEVNKIGLSCIDDKRWILQDNIRTFAHGHFKISSI
jgi:hypothetical protein